MLSQVWCIRDILRLRRLVVLLSTRLFLSAFPLAMVCRICPMRSSHLLSTCWPPLSPPRSSSSWPRKNMKSASSTFRTRMPCPASSMNALHSSIKTKNVEPSFFLSFYMPIFCGLSIFVALSSCRSAHHCATIFFYIYIFFIYPVVFLVCINVFR